MPSMPVERRYGSTDTRLRAHSSDLPDLTGMLTLCCIGATGSLSVVYRCLDEQNIEVAVKVIVFPPGFDLIEKGHLMLKLNHELRIWKKLNHPNIVPFLGTTYGHDFGSNYPCIVSAWMMKGTLFEYMKQRGTKLSCSERIQLIKGLATGLEYLHSQDIIHGNLHPANVLIDGGHNARLDFALCFVPDHLSPGPVLWAAPERLYPGLYPNLEFRATVHSDIYSLGSIILFILSGEYPWRDRGEAENKLNRLQSPPRPMWPVNMPDDVWDFIERCWSPRSPGNRPSAQEVLSFTTDRLEQLLRPE